MAFHLVARATRGTLLFRTHDEARALWERITEVFPELIAFCLMPDHLHLILPHDDVDGRLAAVCSAYARWRNHRRGEHGTVFERLPPPEPIPDEHHLRRTIRYVHLNPCRTGLVDDPLAWPWSTHRDYVGHAIPGVVAVHASPVRFHEYVSADPTVNVEGTELPVLRFDEFGLDAVIAATTSVCPPLGVETRSKVRTLAIQGAWLRGHKQVQVLAERFGCTRATIWNCVHELPEGLVRGKTPELALCIRVTGDPRFGALHSLDLRRSWAPYRRMA